MSRGVPGVGLCRLAGLLWGCWAWGSLISLKPILSQVTCGCVCNKPLS